MSQGKEAIPIQSDNGKGDDTMSSVTQNYVYQIGSKKDSDRKEPTVSKDRLEAIKRSVGKYLTDKK